MNTGLSEETGRRYQYEPARQTQGKKQRDEFDLTFPAGGASSRRSNGLLLAIAATICLIGILLASQGVFKIDQWWAIYYPDSKDRTERIDLGRHTSLEQCREAVKDHVSATSTVFGAYAHDYECGLNCSQLTEGLEQFVCEDAQR